jgi:hypothetical protein
MFGSAPPAPAEDLGAGVFPNGAESRLYLGARRAPGYLLPEILGEDSGYDYADVPRVLHWNISYVLAKFWHDYLDPKDCGGHRYPQI